MKVADFGKRSRARDLSIDASCPRRFVCTHLPHFVDKVSLEKSPEGLGVVSPVLYCNTVVALADGVTPRQGPRGCGCDFPHGL